MSGPSKKPSSWSARDSGEAIENGELPPDISLMTWCSSWAVSAVTEGCRAGRYVSKRESRRGRGCLCEYSRDRGDEHRELKGEISALVESSRSSGGGTSRDDRKEKFSLNISTSSSRDLKCLDDVWNVGGGI